MNAPTPRSDTGFPCTGCGACCRVAGLFGHPSFDGKKCLFLDDRTNLCLIYETRPEICRFGAKKPPGQSLALYAEDAADGCNLLQEHFGIDPSYRVTLRR